MLNLFKRKILIPLIAFLLTSCFVPLGNSINENELLKLEPELLNSKVVAHKGAWKTKQLPENSIAALKEAIAIKCKGSEFDVRFTADDSLIINHDLLYNNLDIDISTYNQLVQFRLANNEKLPTLREYLIAGMLNNSSTKLFCELKSSYKSKARNFAAATKMVQLVKNLKAEKFVIYIGFDFEVLKKIKELDSLAIIHYLTKIEPLEVKNAGMAGIGFYFQEYRERPDFIESARNNNLTLNSYTANHVEDIDFLIINNFDLITTDEPHLVARRLFIDKNKL
jgi:glycerophosphoryl diester phosphodiesterase